MVANGDDAALREAADCQARLDVLDLLDGNPDFHDPEVMAGAWRCSPQGEEPAS